MGVAARVIPTLLDKHSQLVKGRGFAADRVVGHTRQAIRLHQQRGVDELIYLDVTATPEGRGPDFDAVEEFAAEMFSPLTVGGGVRSVEDVRRLLAIGADKVAIGAAVYEVAFVIRDCAEYFGSQCIVYAMDVMGGNTVMFRGGKHGYSHSPRKCAEWAEDHGAGEIMLTSVERDGTMEGYDIDLIREVTNAVDIPVIASGGCGTPQHALEAIQAGASAVAIGAMFIFSEETPKSVAAYLGRHGVEVRQ